MLEATEVVGPVVASLSVSREKTAILQLYPVRRHDYPDDAAIRFKTEVLGYLKGWLDRQLSKRETAVLGYEQLIVEWIGASHRYHEVRFL